jgi:hypothetical protein
VGLVRFIWFKKRLRKREIAKVELYNTKFRAEIRENV